MKTMTTLTTATKKDFKLGTTLITSEGYEFTITSKYDDGIWNTKSNSGSKIVFENEARCYKIKA